MLVHQRRRVGHIGYIETTDECTCGAKWPCHLNQLVQSISLSSHKEFRSMKTLAQHNQEMADIEAKIMELAKKSGVLCNTCNVEMEVMYPNLTNLSNSIWVKCPVCTMRGLKRV